MTREYRERLLKHYETIGNKKDYEELNKIMKGKEVPDEVVTKIGKKST